MVDGAVRGGDALAAVVSIEGSVPSIGCPQSHGRRQEGLMGNYVFTIKENKGIVVPT